MDTGQKEKKNERELAEITFLRSMARYKLLDTIKNKRSKKEINIYHLNNMIINLQLAAKIIFYDWTRNYFLKN